MKNRRMLLKQKDKECPIMYLIQKNGLYLSLKHFELMRRNIIFL